MDKVVFILNRDTFNSTAIQEMVNNPEIYGETLTALIVSLVHNTKEFNFTSADELFDFFLKLD